MKTAFSIPNGHYEYVRMPEGLRNAPATFQRLMDNVLRRLQGTELFVYLDDIVIFANLILEPEKCEFLRREVAYLGHIIGRGGVRPDPKKLMAVAKFPKSKTQKAIRQFLGLAGYYRRFIQNFSTRAKPLSDLLKKGKEFSWGREQNRRFRDL